MFHIFCAAPRCWKWLRSYFWSGSFCGEEIRWAVNYRGAWLATSDITSTNINRQAAAQLLCKYWLFPVCNSLITFTGSKFNESRGVCHQSISQTSREIEILVAGTANIHFVLIMHHLFTIPYKITCFCCIPHWISFHEFKWRRKSNREFDESGRNGPVASTHLPSWPPKPSTHFKSNL